MIPEQASVGEAWKQFDTEGKLKDPDLEKRLMEVGEQVARYTFLLLSDQSREFLTMWERSRRNPGG